MDEPRFDPLDYVSVFNRRKWWFLVPVALSIVIGGLLVWKLPRTYQATTTVAVNAARVSANMVGAVEIDRAERMRAVSQQLAGIGQGAREVGAAAPRSERHKVTNDAQRVSPPLGGPHDILGHVGEEQRADAVIVPRGRECQHGGDLDGKARLGVGAAEVQRTRLVHDEEERELALFHKRLDEGMTHSRRDIPVDCPEVVALLVGADLGELDPLAAEDRAVFAREQGADEVTSS